MSDKRILIVDDVQSMRLVVKFTLESMELKNVDQASNGKQAIDLIKKNHYDLVISDMEMPVLNGVELLNLIRADEKYKDLPFIMLTSIADKEKILEVIGQSVDSYILKPICPDVLSKRVATALSR